MSSLFIFLAAASFLLCIGLMSAWLVLTLTSPSAARMLRLQMPFNGISGSSLVFYLPANYLVDSEPVSLAPASLAPVSLAQGLAGAPFTWNISSPPSPGAAGATYLVQAVDTVKYLHVRLAAADNGADRPLGQNTGAGSAYILVANAAPVITEGSSVEVTMDEDGSPQAFTLTLNATGKKNDVLTWSISSPASHGVASAGGTGTSKSIGYTPTANYNGTDAFTVQVSDGKGGIDTIVVNVIIRPRNDPPVNTALPGIGGVAQVGKLLTASTGVWNDSLDLQPGALTYSYQWQRADNNSGLNVTSIPGATGATYAVQAADARKHLRVRVTATDNGEGLPASQSASADSAFVLVVNTAPVAHPDVFEFRQGEIIDLTGPKDGVLGNDIDVDHDVLTAFLVTPPGKILDPHLDFVLRPDGTFRYNPDPDFVGADTFSYYAMDSGGLQSETVTATITLLDASGPEVAWQFPNTDENGVFYVDTLTVMLEVTATDNIAVDRVRFYRYDPNTQTYIDIGFVASPPYRIVLDVAPLDMGYNQIFAKAYDNQGNESIRQRILLYRTREELFKTVQYLPLAAR